MSETDRETGQLEGDRLECEMQAGQRMQHPERGDACMSSVQQGMCLFDWAYAGGFLSASRWSAFHLWWATLQAV